MTELRRGATETITITLPEGIDPTDYSEIHIDIVQDDLTYDKTGDDIKTDDQTLSVTLSEAETAAFQAGFRGWIQVQLTNTSGTLVSDKEPVRILPKLIDREG